MSVRRIHDVLEEQAQLRPNASAILGLEHSPLSYGRLYEHIQHTIQALHSFGVGRFQRVGLIAPPGPELATAMLSIASCATVVPLNPNLQAAEYQSYFPLLKLDWIMVPAGTAAEARNAARASAIPVIDMYPAGTEAPLDRLEDIAVRQAQEIRAVQIRGPYFLCGFSYGGRVAMETGRVLRDKYGETAYVLMIDDHIQANKYETQRQQMRQSPIMALAFRLQSLAYVIFRLPLRFKLRYASERLHQLLSNDQTRVNNRLAKNREFEDQEALMPSPMLQVKRANQRAAKTFVPKPYSGPLTYLRASNDEINIPFFRTWDKIRTSASEIIDIPGGHWTVMNPPHINTVAAHLQRWLDRYQEPA